MPVNDGTAEIDSVAVQAFSCADNLHSVFVPIALLPEGDNHD